MSSIDFPEAEELGDCDEERDSFLHPTFTLRKRKRFLNNPDGKKDEDAVSVSSLDLEQEPPKRKKSLNKMASLSNVSAALSKVGKRCSALQKSISSSRFGSPVGRRAPSTASLARSASNVFGDTSAAAAVSGRQSPGSVSLQVSITTVSFVQENNCCFVGATGTGWLGQLSVQKVLCQPQQQEELNLQPDPVQSPCSYTE